MPARIRVPRWVSVLALAVGGMSLLFVTSALLPLLHTDQSESWRDTIRIGYAIEPPYAFVNKNGNVTGESPELARIVARRAGIRSTRFVLCDFNRLIDALVAGEIDVIASGMFITPKRIKRIAFSQPTTTVHPGLLVQRGNPHKIDGYGAFTAGSGVRVAVLNGSVEQGYLLASGASSSAMVIVQTPQEALTALHDNAIQAIALSAPTVSFMVASSPSEFEAIAGFTPGEAPPEEHCAFGFRLDDTSLRQAFDAALAGYLGTQEHIEMISRFGFDRSALPQTR